MTNSGYTVVLNKYDQIEAINNNIIETSSKNKMKINDSDFKISEKDKVYYIYS